MAWAPLIWRYLAHPLDYSWNQSLHLARMLEQMTLQNLEGKLERNKTNLFQIFGNRNAKTGEFAKMWSANDRGAVSHSCDPVLDPSNES